MIASDEAGSDQMGFQTSSCTMHRGIRVVMAVNVGR